MTNGDHTAKGNTMGKNEAIKYLMDKYSITYNCASYYMSISENYMPTAGSFIREDKMNDELCYND